MSPADRIYNMWFAVFVLRQWRSWIMGHKEYRAEHFITYNAYMCVELNA